MELGQSPNVVRMLAMAGLGHVTRCHKAVDSSRGASSHGHVRRLIYNTPTPPPVRLAHEFHVKLVNCIALGQG